MRGAFRLGRAARSDQDFHRGLLGCMAVLMVYSLPPRAARTSSQIEFDDRPPTRVKLPGLRLLSQFAPANANASASTRIRRHEGAGLRNPRSYSLLSSRIAESRTRSPPSLVFEEDCLQIGTMSTAFPL